ncbi:MAG TPA: protein kinase [Propionibacteriaceae bacterium]|nr:protein kinase [Propionibacteriaceae bacterium]
MPEAQALIAGRYRLVRLVGSGGMGEVWEAWDERLERRVALKQLRRQSGLSASDAELANRRAMREARIAARLHHPHAVPVFDVIEHDGQACLTMQFIPSITLSAVLAEGGPLQPDEAAKVGAQIASALAAAHSVNIVHRDVKPGNVLIAEDGTALISDFGISRALGDATLTTSGMVHGTPAFLAPEVARGEASSFASDVFSLGSTLYAALEGTPPFGKDENSIALLHRVAAGQFQPPQRSGALTPVILQMLSADPGARPPMHAVAHTLTELAAARSGTARPDLRRPSPLPAPTAEIPEVAGAATRSQSVAPASTTAAPRDQPPTTAGDNDELSRPPTGSGDGQPPPRPQRWWRIAAAAVALVALLGVGILIATVLPGRGRDADPQAGSGQSSASVSASAPSTSPTTAGPTRTPEPSLSGSPRTSANPPSLVPSPKATSAPTVNGTPTAAELRRAITSYYALMPGNTDQGWPRMTASYQSNHAGGRQGYQRFWNEIGRVSVSDVTGSPPGSAQATLTYYYKDGRVVRERTAYGLINDGGVLKINSSTVLNSTTM